MAAILLTHLLLLGQLSLFHGSGHQPANPPAPSTPAASDKSDARSETRSESDSIADAFDRSTIGQLFKGRKKLSPEELGHVEFWASLIKEPLMGAVGFIPRLFVASIFLLLFWVLYRGIRKLVFASMGRAHVDPSIRDMLGHLIKWAVMGFGLVIAFNQIGIQITALLTGVSIVGLAIGLAAQETLANFIAGIVIFWDKPFRVGDRVELDGVAGTVQRVTFRSTRMLSGDGEMIVFPNTFVLARKLSNHSAHPVGRINVPIGIAYRESIDAARAALVELPAGDPRVCKDPPPAVVVAECADSGVKLILRFWVKDKAIKTAVYFEYMEKAKNALDAAGIEIPYPHLQLLMPPGEGGARELRAAG